MDQMDSEAIQEHLRRITLALDKIREILALQWAPVDDAAESHEHEWGPWTTWVTAGVTAATRATQRTAHSLRSCHVRGCEEEDRRETEIDLSD